MQFPSTLLLYELRERIEMRWQLGTRYEISSDEMFSNKQEVLDAFPK